MEPERLEHPCGRCGKAEGAGAACLCMECYESETDVDSWEGVREADIMTGRAEPRADDGFEVWLAARRKRKP